MAERRTGRSGDPLLGAVVEALGQGVVRVICAPRGLEVPVGEAVVHDPSGEPVGEAGDLLLAVGVEVGRRSALDLVARCGELAMTAVLVKADEVPAALMDAAEAAGVALLAAPRDASWGQLHVLLRSARSAVSSRRSAATPLGDLFGLADAVSALVGGAVTVEDEHSVVLAYSSTPFDVDQPRRDTILGRRVPEEWLTRLHETGFFRRLHGTDDVVRLELEGARPRLAVAVRAGGELLGSLWVVEGARPLDADAERGLAEAASMAALHLLRARTGEDLERRRAGEQLRAVLDERLPPALLAEALGTPAGAPVAVVGMQLPDAGDAGPLALERATDIVLLACAAFRRRVVVGVVGRTLYAVLPLGPASGRELLADLAGRVATGLRAPVRAVVADAADGAAGVLSARAEVDLTLRVLAEEPVGDGAVCRHADDLQARTVLLRLRDLTAARPELAVGRLQSLVDSDRDRGTSYIPTLRAFLDTFGDVRTASELVLVHPNTFRYRLRRLSELAGLDLDNPVERLVAHLQLHLLVPEQTDRRTT
jgi:hypothetical protein